MPALMREVVSAFAAAFLVYLAVLITHDAYMGAILAIPLSLLVRPTLLEWRFHDRMSRVEWTPKVAATYRALAQSRRSRTRGMRIVFALVFLHVLISMVAATLRGEGNEADHVAAVAAIFIAVVRMYVECVAPDDPELFQREARGLRLAVAR